MADDVDPQATNYSAEPLPAPTEVDRWVANLYARGEACESADVPPTESLELQHSLVSYMWAVMTPGYANRTTELTTSQC